jgi:hypothetical protein
MDLALYFRVLWRFRVLVGIGFVLALVLATLSFAKVSFAGGSPRVTYRQAETWQSEAVLFVTQRDFPWGTTAPQYEPANPNKGLPAIPTADVGRLSSQAIIYANLAPTQLVQRYMRHLPLRASDISVAAIPAPPFSSPAILPLISVKALGTSQQVVAALAADQARAIMRYVRGNQLAAHTPVSDRIILQEVQVPRPELATLVGKRGKTLPIIVFLAVMIAVLGLAFVLENLRPAIRAVDEVEDESDLHAEQVPQPVHRRTYG